ncbi:PorT family protein [Flavobacterium silvisoli]|uniref:PorT family protein n=1 Tax=Flavobacterium silvisoli TaxID=2529433 RepID=A0A4Q9Z4V7_9FLAO|nr:porin family protein [Flavobacterium silvisoli]TBX70416.1 PorT family protein [Flavobacterium silvisoli]
MKKIILTMAVVLTAAFANAQKKGASEDMRYGIKGGLVSANYGADANDGDPRTGFYLGGLVDFTISEKFHVQPELLYTMEGNGEKEFDLNFIRIPVLAKFYVADAFSLHAGPEIAFVAGGGDAKDYLKSMDFALGFGAAYELPSGLFFDARYNLGLSDLNDFPSGSGLETAKITQNSFNIGLGYRF